MVLKRLDRLPHTANVHRAGVCSRDDHLDDERVKAVDTEEYASGRLARLWLDVVAAVN